MQAHQRRPFVGAGRVAFVGLRVDAVGRQGDDDVALRGELGGQPPVPERARHRRVPLRTGPGRVPVVGASRATAGPMHPVEDHDQGAGALGADGPCELALHLDRRRHARQADRRQVVRRALDRVRPARGGVCGGICRGSAQRGQEQAGDQQADGPNRHDVASLPSSVGGSRHGYSHSMVPGGFEVMSSTTRFTAGTSLMIRLLIRSSRSYGSRAQSAVMASSEVTARMTTGYA